MIPCHLPSEDTSRPELPATFTGGCHCGAVRSKVTVRSWRASDCNCTLCSKKGYRHIITKKEDLELLSGKESLSTYAFNTKVAQHHFCARCGIHSFYVPRSHPSGFSVNARCLDNAPLAWFDHEFFDGQNWEKHIHELNDAEV